MYELELFCLTHFGDTLVELGYRYPSSTFSTVFHERRDKPISLAVRDVVLKYWCFYDWILKKTAFSTFPRRMRIYVKMAVVVYHWVLGNLQKIP